MIAAAVRTSLAISAFLVAMVPVHGIYGQWKQVDTNTTATLRSIFFVDAQLGWVAGSHGTLLSTLDGGRTWQKRRLPVKDNVREVFFADRYTGWVLCEADVYSSNETELSYLLKTDDGGDSWFKVPFVTGRDRIVGILFGSNGNGIAFGEGGMVWQTAASEKWTSASLPVHQLMLGGVAVDGQRYFLVGAGGQIVFTDNAGLSWQSTTISGRDGIVRLNGVFFTDKKTGFVVGDKGLIFGSTNEGRSWKQLRSGVTADLMDVVFSDRSHGIAVGRSGTILRTSDGGETWVRDVSNIKTDLQRIMISGDQAWIIGLGGVILVREVLH